MPYYLKYRINVAIELISIIYESKLYVFWIKNCLRELRWDETWAIWKHGHILVIFAEKRFENEDKIHLRLVGYSFVANYLFAIWVGIQFAILFMLSVLIHEFGFMTAIATLILATSFHILIIIY